MKTLVPLLAMRRAFVHGNAKPLADAAHGQQGHKGLHPALLPDGAGGLRDEMIERGGRDAGPQPGIGGGFAPQPGHDLVAVGASGGRRGASVPAVARDGPGSGGGRVGSGQAQGR